MNLQPEQSAESRRALLGNATGFSVQGIADHDLVMPWEMIDPDKGDGTTVEMMTNMTRVEARYKVMRRFAMDVMAMDSEVEFDRFCAKLVIEKLQKESPHIFYAMVRGCYEQPSRLRSLIAGSKKRELTGNLRAIYDNAIARLQSLLG